MSSLVIKSFLSFLFFFSLFSSFVVAADDSFFYKNSLVINGSLINPVNIVSSGFRPRISSLDVNLSWFPRDDSHQRILSFSTDPPASSVSDKSVFFHVDNPSFGVHNFNVYYKVRTNANIVHVKHRIPFPLGVLDSSLSPYLSPTDTIDITPEIRSLASSLAADEDDLYLLVVKLASWVKDNVNYNLSTVAAEASQPSSWVLANRQGVCDELTNLFISLNRALGIPARFVSGLSYSNSPLFVDPWGAHGWAEVYFPGVGWVPFDVTYGQFGWVDATHVVFSRGVDSGKYSSSFSWLGRDVDVVPLGMSFSTDVVSQGSDFSPNLFLSARLSHNNLGPGSFGALIVNVSNPTSFYVADELLVALVDGIDFLDGSRVVALPPHSSKEVVWRFRIVADLDPGFRYSFPLMVYSQRGANDSVLLDASVNGRIVDESVVDSLLVPVQSSFSDALVCRGPSVVRINESFSVVCNSSFSGDVVVCDPFGSCLSDGFVFPLSLSSPGLYSLRFSARSSGDVVYSFVPVEVVVPPVLSLNVSRSPSVLDYSSLGEVSFSLSLLQGSSVGNVSVVFSSDKISKDWFFSSFSGEKSFVVRFPGSALSGDTTVFSVSVSYVDERGVVNSLSKSFVVRLGRISWWQRILLWLDNFFR